MINMISFYICAYEYLNCIWQYKLLVENKPMYSLTQPQAVFFRQVDPHNICKCVTNNLGNRHWPLFTHFNDYPIKKPLS